MGELAFGGDVLVHRWSLFRRMVIAPWGALCALQGSKPQSLAAVLNWSPFLPLPFPYLMYPLQIAAPGLKSGFLWSGVAAVFWLCKPNGTWIWIKGSEPQGNVLSASLVVLCFVLMAWLSGGWKPATSNCSALL